jgi:hypothetical protein
MTQRRLEGMGPLTGRWIEVEHILALDLSIAVGGSISSSIG